MDLIRLGTEKSGVLIDFNRFIGAAFNPRFTSGDRDTLLVVLRLGEGNSVTVTLKGDDALAAWQQLRKKGVDVE